MFGFLYAYCGWLLHKDLHAVLNLKRLDHKVRPRIYPQIIASSNASKSPFFTDFAGVGIAGNDANDPLPSTHAPLFADGGEKGFYYSEATNADFANRMGATSGRLFWATAESWLVLDTDYASGTSKKDPLKVDMHRTLEMQNGGRFLS